MKKMMVVLAAISMAVVAGAAQVNWSVAGVTAPTGETLAAGWAAIFVASDTLPVDMAKMTASDWSTFAGANADSTGTLSVSARAKTFSGSSADKYAAGADVNGYIVMFDNANIGNAKYYAYTTPTKKTVPDAGNLTWSVTSFASGTSGWTAVATPEPTSGLLLLLGMAGLALRRRRA